MKKHTKFLATILALPLALAACKDDNDDTTETGKKLETTPEELRGTWLSGCVKTTVLGLTSTQREYILNAIGDFDRKERYFSDANCQNLVATYKVIGTVEAKGQNPDKPEIDMLNFTINNAYLTLNADNITGVLNTTRLCGKADWAVGAETEVTNADCQGSTVKKGEVQFDSYDVRDGQLYLGQKFLFLAKENANDRPTQLATDVPYAKQ